MSSSYPAWIVKHKKMSIEHQRQATQEYREIVPCQLGIEDIWCGKDEPVLNNARPEEGNHFHMRNLQHRHIISIEHHASRMNHSISNVQHASFPLCWPEVPPQWTYLRRFY